MRFDDSREASLGTIEWFDTFRIVTYDRNAFGAWNRLVEVRRPTYLDALAARYWDGDNDGNYTDADETEYAAHDANFNVTALLDRTGGVIERYEYTPYGEVSYLDVSFGSQASSSVANCVLYTGRWRDADTGLYDYRYRFCQAPLGRFLSRDRIGYRGSKRNLYEYVNGRPTMLTAFYGLQIQPPLFLPPIFGGFPGIDEPFPHPDELFPDLPCMCFGFPRCSTTDDSPRRRPKKPKECYCMCMKGTRGTPSWNGPHPVGRMSPSACNALPFFGVYSFCYCK